MLRNKSLGALCALIIASLILAACATANQPPAAETSAPAATAETGGGQATGQESGGVVELNYFERNNAPATWDEANWVVDSFNEEFAGKIHVTISGVDGVTYRTKAPIELRSDSPPDVFFSWEGGWAQKMIDSGFAASLDPYYDKYGWADFLSKGGVSLATFDGTKYFVPYEMSAALMWYRPDVYEQNGISVPKTWDEFLSNCETLKENSIYCLMTANQAKWPAQFEWTSYYVNSSGLETYNKLIHNEIPWTDASVVEAFAAMRNLAERGYLYPGWNSIDQTPALIPFSKGEVANWFQGTWMINNFKGDAEEIPYPVDFYQFPQVGNNPPVMSVFAENTLMIHANSPHQDEAAEFLNYYISQKAQQHKVDSQLPYPANTTVDLSPLIPLAQKVGAAMSGAGEFTFMHVDHQFDPSIADVFLNQLQAVLDGAVTPEKAAELVEAEAVKVRGQVP
jgi:raffinose/stachyose/melibiose transport system substrate-binding protein